MRNVSYKKQRGRQWSISNSLYHQLSSLQRDPIARLIVTCAMMTASLYNLYQHMPAACTPPHPPNRTYDQIVHLSLVEGGVRLFRGKEGEHATVDVWEQPQSTCQSRQASASLPAKAALSSRSRDDQPAYQGRGSPTLDEIFTIHTPEGRSCSNRC